MSGPRRDLLASLAPLTKALRRVEDRAAETAGLTMWQYAILSVVDQAPGMNQGEVAQRLAYSPNRIIADLDHLEQQQLLTRRPATDRRANLLEVTAAGVDVMRQVRREIHRGEDALLATLTPDQRADLHTVVHAAAEAVRGPLPRSTPS